MHWQLWWLENSLIVVSTAIIIFAVVNCGPLDAPDNGQVETSSGTTFGSTASYSCNTNYTLSGSASRTCEAGGTWTASAPVCEIIDCGPLTAPANGQVDTSSGTTIARIATYSCDNGYTLVGSSSRTCGTDGIWTSSVPICDLTTTMPTTSPTTDATTTPTTESTTAETTSSEVDCGPLTAPDNGQVDTSSGTTFGSTAMFSCDTGYTLSGSSTRTCGADGNWTPTAPLCERVIVQIRFGPLNCIDYTSTNSLQKIDSLSSVMITSIEQTCSCDINSNVFITSQLHCFDQSPQTVTFRTQLSENTETTTSELISYLEDWLEANDQLVVSGVGQTLNKTCPLIITTFDSEECPNVPTSATDTLPGGPTSISGLLIACVVLGVILLLSIAFNFILFVWIAMSRRRNKESYELRECEGPSDNVYMSEQQPKSRLKDFDPSLTYENMGGATPAAGQENPYSVCEYQFQEQGNLKNDAEIIENAGKEEVKPKESGVYEEIENFRETSVTSLSAQGQRQRTSSVKIADCPVYGPVDIKLS